VNCDCHQDTTSDNEKELSSCESSLMMTLRRPSSLLESDDTVPVADSSTVLTDQEPTPALSSTSHSHVSQATTRNRLLMQLLAGTSVTDASSTETASHVVSVMSVPSSQSVSAMMSTQASQSLSAMMQSWAMASNELSEDLNSVNVADLLSVPDLLAQNPGPVNQTGSTSKLDFLGQNPGPVNQTGNTSKLDLMAQNPGPVTQSGSTSKLDLMAQNPGPVTQTGSSSKLDLEDQLLMVQLEQAIMNSELSLEDLDHLLAVSSSTVTSTVQVTPPATTLTISTAPVTLSAASTTSTVTDSQRHSTVLGKSHFSVFFIVCYIRYFW